MLKTIFFLYNFSGVENWFAGKVVSLIGWSLLYDGLCIAIINLPLIALIILFGSHGKRSFVLTICLVVFAAINAFMILLNTADIFYFPFHLQRADADLFYVLRDPLKKGNFTILLVATAVIIFFSLAVFICYLQIKKISKGGKPWLTFATLTLFLLLFIAAGKKKLLPTFPLTSIKSYQLPLVQNSFHTFCYSVYRRDAVTLPKDYGLPISEQQALFNIKKKSSIMTGAPKNIVLFIMESVPAEFFDSTGKYKVAMPFVDSLVNKSTFFSNAYSFSYSSNKGITSILSGLPTLIDIPLYHSNFTGIERTSVGTALAKNHYESSFFIGDNYDDFGFAQCCNWLGIQHYYSMEDIPGYKKMEKHTMGLHDQYVLNFMQEKISNMRQPFFTVNYNISTHYPYSLPPGYITNNPEINIEASMKSMAYYSHSLQQFFAAAEKQAWYNNTVFIFCSDHWFPPTISNTPMPNVGSFHIPIFIFDPANPQKRTVTSPVSQFDIVNTIMYFSGNRDSIISYGYNLADTALDKHRTVFTKTNTAIYQAINERYVLGFNASDGQAVYCYDHRSDPQNKNNILQRVNLPAVDSLILETKAFLQTAVKHYKNELR